MVGGNCARDGEGCSLSCELYCCYGFPIRKKDGPPYWPTTSMKVCFNHTGHRGHLSPEQFIKDVIHCSESSVWLSCACITLSFFHEFVPVVLIGSSVRWLLLPEEVHQAQWCSVLVNAGQNYVHSPRNSISLWWVRHRWKCSCYFFSTNTQILKFFAFFPLC